MIIFLSYWYLFLSHIFLIFIFMFLDCRLMSSIYIGNVSLSLGKAKAMIGRGRPAIDDDALLRKIAAKLAKNPQQSPRSAIVQALPEFSDSAVRRLQRKWRERGEAYLKAARESFQERPVSFSHYAEASRRLAAVRFPSQNLDQILRAQTRVQDLLEGGAIGRALSQVQSVQRALDSVDPLRHMRNVLEQQERLQRLVSRF